MEPPPRYGNWNGNVELAMGAKHPSCGNPYYEYYQQLIKNNMIGNNGEEVREPQDAPEPDPDVVKLKVGQAGWAVVDEEGNFIDIFTYEVKRENLVLHDTERIIEVTITPV
jgi:hypothetical protein